ncbi:TetR/AcrR family transcriptional regulator [Streptomyces sp. NPDC093544]|jgi:TetR/AcrR family transcriptional regulator|uniref:TetR/AcrR family transcriptional regulator n=1 Tax=Streptomyces sp. NPDC093544 TaxID=3155200 RepID=UPI003440543F
MATRRSAQTQRGPGRPPADAPRPDLAEIHQRGLEAFAELGYEAVSVRQLNERLGMGHTFIHDRYGSKEAFWRAVMETAIQDETDEVMAALAKEQPVDDLALLIAGVRAFHQAAARRPHLTRVIDYEAGRDSPRLAHLYTLMSPLHELGRPAFDRLVRAGTLRDIPWYLFHFAVTKPMALYGQAPLARMLGRTDDADDHTLMSTLILNGLLMHDRPTEAGVPR